MIKILSFIVMGAVLGSIMGSIMGSGRSISFATHAANTEESPSGFSCDLWDDEQGVPHLRAKDAESLFACLGFVHARDRAWQLDFFRRTAQGRRAEVLGPSHIRSDFQMRLLNLPTKARSLFSGLPQAEKRLWEAYSRGINQGMVEALRLGVMEFTHWGYRPEAWNPADSLSLLLLQSFDQTRKTFAVQLDETRKLSQQESPSSGENLNLPREFPLKLPWETAILRSGEFLPKTESTATKTGNTPHPLHFSGVLTDFFSPTAGEGSNNWVVAPARSRSGRALLANDPHLGLNYPPLWHFSHIESPTHEAFGASMPGIPVIVSGANRHAAWGLTNSYLEVARLTLVPESDLKNAFTERPWIWVKLWKFRLPYFFKALRRTPSGFPVLPVEAPAGQAVVLTWTGYDLEPSDLEGLFPLMSARSARDIDRTLTKVGVPSWNFVFADTQGNIGYRAVGRIPKVTRPRELGMASGRLSDLEASWRTKPLLSNLEMPHALNPSRGYLSTANNRHWPAEALFHGGYAYTESFRAYRIDELLEAQPKHDTVSFSRIQCDTQAVDARFLVPLLLLRLQEAYLWQEMAPLSIAEENAISILKSWEADHFNASSDCKACAIFRRWVTHLYANHHLSEADLFRALNDEVSDELSLALIESFRTSIRELRKPESADFPVWESVHINDFPHLADKSFFSGSTIPTPGDDHSVNPGTSRFERGIFRQISGASQRLIVELSEPPVIHSILSGPNAASTNRNRELEAPDSPWLLWRDCKTLKRNFPVNWNAVSFQELKLN